MHPQRFLGIPVLVTVALLLAAADGSTHELNDGRQSVNYSNWVNRAGKGCCNNQDCRPIADSDVQLSPVLKVRIGGRWCQVKREHYLRTGNAANWQSNHVCIRPYGDGSDPCSRLLCFQPKPLF